VRFADEEASVGETGTDKIAGTGETAGNAAGIAACGTVKSGLTASGAEEEA